MPTFTIQPAHFRGRFLYVPVADRNLFPAAGGPLTVFRGPTGLASQIQGCTLNNYGHLNGCGEIFTAPPAGPHDLPELPLQVNDAVEYRLAGNQVFLGVIIRGGGAGEPEGEGDQGGENLEGWPYGGERNTEFGGRISGEIKGRGFGPTYDGWVNGRDGGGGNVTVIPGTDNPPCTSFIVVFADGQRHPPVNGRSELDRVLDILKERLRRCGPNTEEVDVFTDHWDPVTFRMRHQQELEDLSRRYTIFIRFHFVLPDRKTVTSLPKTTAGFPAEGATGMSDPGRRIRSEITKNGFDGTYREWVQNGGGSGGNVTVIPGNGNPPCTHNIVVFAKNRRGRWHHGFGDDYWSELDVNLTTLKARLIRCHVKTKEVDVFTDNWDSCLFMERHYDELKEISASFRIVIRFHIIGADRHQVGELPVSL